MVDLMGIVDGRKINALSVRRITPCMIKAYLFPLTKYISEKQALTFSQQIWACQWAGSFFWVRSEDKP